MVRRTLTASYRTGRKLLIGLAGATVLLAGVALLVLPGPAVVVIPLGLAILAAEFAWARRWLKGLRDASDRMLERLRSGAA